MADLLNLLKTSKAVGEITPTAFGVSNTSSDIINPLVNVKAVNKTISDISSIGTEFRTPDFRNAKEYEDYKVSINPIDDDLDKQRAKNQGSAEQLFNAVAQTAVSEIGLGTALGASNLFDAVGSAIFGGDGDYSNPISAQLEQWQEQFRNATPIYQENPNESFQIGDFGWWMSNAPSVASSISLLLPAAAATKGLSMLGKGLQLGKAAKAVNKAIGFGKFDALLKPSQMATASQWVETGMTAALSRTMENYQEARQTYNDMYGQATQELNSMSDKDFNSWLDKNPNYKEYTNKDDIAKDIASRSADVTFAEDYANVVFDVLQLHALKNIWKGVRIRPSTGGLREANEMATLNVGKSSEEIAKAISQKTLTKKAIDKTKNFILGSKTLIAAEATEGVEEAVNYVAQQEGMYYGSKILGKEVESNFDDRLTSYLKDGQLWESAFWGVLGGIVFQGVGSKLGQLKNKVIDKEQLTEEEQRKAEIYGRSEKWNSFVADINKINEGKDIYSETREETFENEAMKDLARQRREDAYIADLTLNAANFGNIKLLKSYLSDDNIKKAMIEQGVTTEQEANSYTDRMLNIVQKVEDSYDKNILLLDNKNVSPEYARIIATENVRYDLENDNIQRNIDQVENNIARLSEEPSLAQYNTVENQQAIDLGVKIARTRVLNKEKNRIANEQTVSSQIAKRNIENEIKAINTSIVDDMAMTYFEYESLIESTKDKNGNIKVDNTKAQAFIDSKIEKQGDPTKYQADFETYRISQAGRYTQINNVSQELADNMMIKSMYELQSLLNTSNKIVTDTQIKTKVNQMNNIMDDARRTAINNSYEDIQKLYDKYNTNDILNYINRNAKDIPNITKEDKDNLDTALNILDLTSETNVQLYDDLQLFAIQTELKKTSKPSTTVNGTAIDETIIEPPSEEIVTPEIKPETNSLPVNPIEPKVEPIVDVIPEPIVKPEAKADIIIPQRNEEEIFKAGNEVIKAVKINKEINLEELKNTIVNDYLKKGFTEQEILDVVEPTIRSVRNLLTKSTRNSTISEEFKLAADEVLVRNSEIVENTPTKDYLNAVDNYINKYIKSIGLKETSEKVFVNLESLMRYTKANTDNQLLADIIYNNIRSVLINQSNENGRYILTDKKEVETLNKGKFFENVNKTSKERLQEKLQEISKQRVDIYSQEETPEYLSALQNLQAGQNLNYDIKDNTIYIKSNNVRIGRLPIPTVTKTGNYLMYNNGWAYDISRDNGIVKSELKDLFKDWLVTRSDEQSVEELNEIINNTAYNTVLNNEQKANLIQQFTNNKEIINAKTNGFIASNANAEQLLDGLASIYRYVGQQFDNTDRYIAIDQWFDKLANSYDGVTELAKGNKQVRVADISDGEAIVLTKNENKPVQEAIVGFNPNVHRLMVTMQNNILSVAGVNNTYSFPSKAGSTFVLLPNRSGNNTYAQAYPNNIFDNTNAPQIKDMAEYIRTTVKDMVIKKGNGEISYAEFTNFINGLFNNGKGKTSLLNNVIVTEQANNITLSVQGTNNRVTFFDKNREGKNAKNIGIAEKTYVTADTKGFNDIINNILKEASFNISFGGVKSDMYQSFSFGDNPVLNKEDGVFKITIGDRNWQFNSFNDFIMGNNLVKVHIGKTEDGKSNFRRQGIKPGTNQVLNVQIENITNPPVEESEKPITTISNNTSSIMSTINNTKIKNKGSKIVETLTDKRTKDLFKRLGIIPENVIFVEEIKDQNGNLINAQVNTRTGIVTITNQFLAMAETDPRQAFRKIIHEGLHNQIAKDNSILNQLNEIYDAFIKHVETNDADNKQINRYKFEGLNKKIQLEEFLVESLTSAELANYLNNISINEANELEKPKTLFQKIMEVLMKIMGIDINQGSLYAQEFIVLGEQIQEKQQETVITQQIEETKSEEAKPYTAITTEEGFNLGEIDDVFNSNISEYNNDNSKLNMASYLNALPLSEQASIATLLGDGTLNFTCR